jgi:phospholipid/cholesterol/gamma-HCH transport system ATP-binding protein
MFILEDIHRFFGQKHILNGVSFAVEPGTITGLIGPSGGGKSTLLKILAGVIHPSHGAFQLDICKSDEIGLMFQEGALFDSMSVYDNLSFPLVQGEVPTWHLEDDQKMLVHAKVQEILLRVGLVKASQKIPGQLSGGMRRRISLARALISRPRLLLLDDPTAGLDPIASNVIMNLITAIHKEYRPTIIIVSHDLRRLLPRVNEVVALFNGQVRFQGTLADLKTQPCSQLSTFVSSRYTFQ